MYSRIDRQWPAALLFISGSLKAGLTIEEALDLLAREAPEPLRKHLAQSARGTEVAPGSVRITQLLAGDALALPRAALLFSQRAGGQAAPILEQCAQTLQIKIETEDRVKALTAQNRISAWVVGMMPLALLAAFSMFAPDYIAPLFQTRSGVLALGVAALLIGAGLFFVQKMARVE